MSQSFAGGAIYSPEFSFRDGPQIDPFGRLKVSEPTYAFDSQFTYGLQPLLWEPIVSGSGAAVSHDATNRCASCVFASTPTGGKAFLQTFEHFRYQPGRGQSTEITFVMGAAVANVKKFAGYSDGTVGIELQQDGTNAVQVVLYGATTAGTQTVTQANWNKDKLDGTGASGITLDLSKSQILVIDMQALYTGRARIGFNIDGQTVWVHYFRHANVIAYPYIQSANLPLRFGMTCSGTVSASMLCVCASVKREGGQLDEEGFPGCFENSLTAANNARTHAMSIQPSLTFNAITNRSKFVLESLALMVQGSNPVVWELVIGQALSGTTAFNAVNATYSGFDYNIAGTLSGSPAMVLATGYCNAGASSKSVDSRPLTQRVPICLDAAGAARVNGRLTLLVTGLTGTSLCRAALNWQEVR